MQSTKRAAPAAEPMSVVHHPITARDRGAMAELRRMAEPNKGKLRGVAAREPFEAIIRRTAAPESVSFHEDRVGGIPGWWCQPLGALPGAALLHLHGGWFNWGSAEAFLHFVGHIARSARARAFVPDYRLAPEHPFPAAVGDVEASLRGLWQSGVRTIGITGDSAGGNLALSLLEGAARAPAGGARIAAAAVLSPVTDLTMSGGSWQTRAEADPYFVRDQAESLINAYLNGHEATDPAASPLYGGFVGLPPIRVHVGDDEVLLDDSLRYVERAVLAGGDARVDVWEGMPHGFLGAVGRLEAAGRVLTDLGAFLSARLSSSLEAA